MTRQHLLGWWARELARELTIFATALLHHAGPAEVTPGASIVVVVSGANRTDDDTTDPAQNEAGDGDRRKAANSERHVPEPGFRRLVSQVGRRGQFGRD